MNNWYLKLVIAHGMAAMPGTDDSQKMLDKLQDRSHRWTHDDLTPEQKDHIYDYTKKSYEKGETKQMFDKNTFWKKVQNGPWTFYGDRDMKGYVTVRDMWEIPGMLKLTGMAGSMKGVLAGMALLQKEQKPLIGAVTPGIFDMAAKGGFKTLSPDQLKMFIQFAPEAVWGHGGKPKINEDGGLSVNMPELNKSVDKKFICNDAFLAWAEKMKSQFTTGSPLN